MNQESFLVARPTDVEAMLTDNRKHFTGYIAEYGSGDKYTSARPDDLRAVVFYILVTSEEPDKDGDMEFLTGTPKDPASDAKLFCCPHVGFFIPDVTASDLVTGRNADRHINPDRSTRVDNLQLTRALVHAAQHYFQEKLQTNFFTQLLSASDQLQIKTELGHCSVTEMAAGFTTLLLSIRLPRSLLTALVQQSNQDNPDSLVTFSVTTLNQANYPSFQPTLN